MPPAQKISHFLHTAQSLQPLAQQAQRVSELQPILRQMLPPQLQPSVWVGHSGTDTLLLSTNNGVIAAKLKQLAPGLLFQLQKQGYKYTFIRIGVQVGRFNPTPTGASGQDIGDLTAWRDLAENLDTGSLKSAVQALLKRRRKS